MKTIGITGGTGFIGTHLTEVLKAAGYHVVIFTRDPERHKKKQHVRYAYWCPEENKCDLTYLKKLNAVINLAGAGIADKRWTDKRKKEIEESRVAGTRFLIEQVKQYAPDCNTLVSASAIGYYGADKSGVARFTEDDAPASDFLAKTCVKWEHEAEKAAKDLRTVILRFGVVLGKDGGMYKEFAKPMNLGAKPILGSGKQMISWIQVEDLAKLIATAVDKESMRGVYNAVAPQPVTHEALVSTIAKEKGGIKIPIPIPSFALKLALGELSEEILKSCTVSAQKVIDAGFHFKYPTIGKAIHAIVHAKQG